VFADLQQESAAGRDCHNVSNNRLTQSNAAISAATDTPSAVSPSQARAAALFGCPLACPAFFSNRRTPARPTQQLARPMNGNAPGDAIISRGTPAIRISPVARNSPLAQRRLGTDVDSVLAGPVQRPILNWSSLMTCHLRLRRPQSASQATAVPVITPPPVPVAHNRISTASDVMDRIIADRAAAGMPIDPGLIAVCERVSQEQRLRMQRPELTGSPASTTHDHQTVTNRSPAAIREDPAVTEQPPLTTITEELELVISLLHQGMQKCSAFEWLISARQKRCKGCRHCCMADKLAQAMMSNLIACDSHTLSLQHSKQCILPEVLT